MLASEDIVQLGERGPLSGRIFASLWGYIAVYVMDGRVLNGTRVDTTNSWSAVIAVRGMSNIQYTTKVVLRFLVLNVSYSDKRFCCGLN